MRYYNIVTLLLVMVEVSSNIMNTKCRYCKKEIIDYKEEVNHPKVYHDDGHECGVRYALQILCNECLAKAADEAKENLREYKESNYNTHKNTLTLPPSYKNYLHLLTRV